MLIIFLFHQQLLKVGFVTMIQTRQSLYAELAVVPY